MDIALIAFGLVLAVLSTIVTHATWRIVFVVVAAVVFVVAGLNALGVFTT